MIKKGLCFIESNMLLNYKTIRNIRHEYSND